MLRRNLLRVEPERSTQLPFLEGQTLQLGSSGQVQRSCARSHKHKLPVSNHSSQPWAIPTTSHTDHTTHTARTHARTRPTIPCFLVSFPFFLSLSSVSKSHGMALCLQNGDREQSKQVLSRIKGYGQSKAKQAPVDPFGTAHASPLHGVDGVGYAAGHSALFRFAPVQTDEQQRCVSCSAMGGGG